MSGSSATTQPKRQSSMRGLLLAAFVVLLYAWTGYEYSWNFMLQIINVALISAIMALGVNIQWGYAGLFSVGTVGFVALGGLAVVLISAAPVPGAWALGGTGILLGLIAGAASIAAAVFAYGRLPKGRIRALGTTAILIGGFFLFRAIFDPAVAAVESNDPASAGNLGGLGLPVLLAWPAGGLLAAAAAWAIGRTALGLRSDYLAIATLGIAEIIIAVMKNEDWLARGVKNVTTLPRPVPYEVDLQESAAFVDWATSWGLDPVTTSSILVKLCYTGLFGAVLLILIAATEAALRSPWGRMMRAIRDNEVAAEAMGKNVVKRHLQVFILGSAVIGVAGAMLITLDGQLTPSSFDPLRFTFMVWVMVILGGSGNNWGSVLGGFIIWWLFNLAPELGKSALESGTAWMEDGWLKTHLLESAAYTRFLAFGVILLLVLRFAPRGLLPER